MKQTMHASGWVGWSQDEMTTCDWLVFPGKVSWLQRWAQAKYLNDAPSHISFILFSCWLLHWAILTVKEYLWNSFPWIASQVSSFWEITDTHVPTELSLTIIECGWWRKGEWVVYSTSLREEWNWQSVLSSSLMCALGDTALASWGFPSALWSAYFSGVHEGYSPRMHHTA